jgi:hypothetical protein
MTTDKIAVETAIAMITAGLSIYEHPEGQRLNATRPAFDGLAAILGELPTARAAEVMIRLAQAAVNIAYLAERGGGPGARQLVGIVAGLFYEDENP